MAPAVIERWIGLVKSGDTADLADLLADDAVFYSPAVFTPQQGRAVTLAYLTAAARLLGGDDFAYVGQWYGEQSAVLEFTTVVDGLQVNGVDIIGWNDEDKIVLFKVMLRPVKALQAVIPAMATRAEVKRNRQRRLFAAASAVAVTLAGVAVVLWRLDVITNWLR